MAKCLVVYGSKYGATEEVARAIAEGLGADLATADSLPDVQPYHVIVVGSPIYAGDYLTAVVRFIRANKSALEERKIAAFITAAADMQINPGLTGEEDEQLYTQQDYADGLAKMAGGEVLATRGFGGRLRPDQLDERDYKMLSWFYRFLMRDDLKGFDLIDLPQARQWGERLKELVGD
jgi:menaquinone-dependent protoporphyrinogen IX oxidase